MFDQSKLHRDRDSKIQVSSIFSLCNPALGIFYLLSENSSLFPLACLLLQSLFFSYLSIYKIPYCGLFSNRIFNEINMNTNTEHNIMK